VSVISRFSKVFLFEEKDALLFRLDPRIKLIKSIILMVIVFFIQDPIKIGILMATLLVEFKILGKVLFKVLRSILYLTPILILIIVANYLATYDIIDTLSPLLRFLLFVMAVDLFFFTTSPDDFSLTLEALRLPMTISLSFSLALRFIPTLSMELNDIIEAQISRGLQLDKGNILTRIRNYIPLLIPLIVLSIKRSIEVAEALEIRGLRPGVKRTSYKTLVLSGVDYAYIIISLIIIIAIYLLELKHLISLAKL